jgi:hypothetical protein
MFLAEQEAVIRFFSLPLGIHPLPVIDDKLIHRAPDMEVQLAVSEIALEQEASLPPVFANVAPQVFPIGVNLAMNNRIVFVVVPDLGHPVDAGDMAPALVVLGDGARHILTEHTSDTLWLDACFVENRASLAEPVVVLVGKLVFDVSPVTCLVNSHVAAVAHHDFVSLSIVII